MENLSNKTHYSAAELSNMNLANLSVSERMIKNIAKRECWICRKREARGGGVEYEFSSLPKEIQAEILIKQAKTADQKSDNLAKTSSAKAINYLPEVIWAPFDKATSKQRETAQARLKAVTAVADLVEHGTKLMDVLEELRIIQEESEVGIALIGNDKVYTRIQGGVSQAHEYARLWSRIGKHFPFKKALKSDIKAIAKAWYLDCEDKELMNVLYEIGNQGGGLRSLTQYLRLAGLCNQFRAHFRREITNAKLRGNMKKHNVTLALKKSRFTG